MVRRIVNLSLVASSFPDKPPHHPPPQYEHHEFLGAEYNRSQLMGFLDLYGFNIGEAGETCMEVTTSVDPMGTHAEVYWLDDRVMFGKLRPDQRWLIRDVPRIPVTQLVGPASVVNMTHIGPGQGIELRDLKQRTEHVRDGDIVFIRTDYGEKMRSAREGYQQRYYDESPGFTVEAAKWLVREKHIKAVGLDTRGPEIEKEIWKQITDISFPVHRVMHDAGVVILEDVANLSELTHQRFTAFCGLPLNIEDLSGGPLMIVGVEDIDGQAHATDLSQRVGPYPGSVPQPPFSRTEPWDQRENVLKRARVRKLHFSGLGYGYPDGMPDWAELVTFTSKLGTHVEVPYTQGARTNGYSPADMEADKMVGHGVVLDMRRAGPETCISARMLSEAAGELHAGDIALLRTGFSDWYYNIPGGMHRTPYLEPEAAQWLIDAEVKMVVTDMAAVDPLNSDGPRPARDLLLEADVPIVNNAANLWLLKKGEAFVACLPLPYKGMDSSPVRLVAMESYA